MSNHTSPTSIQTLNDFLTSLSGIRFLEVRGDVLAEKQGPSSSLASTPWSFTFSELGNIDVRLPLAIAGLLKTTVEATGNKSARTIFTSNLHATVNYWQKTHLLRTKTGQDIPYIKIRSIDVRHMNLPGENVSINLLISDVVEHTDKLGDSVFIAPRSMLATCEACPVWLDNQYPGWRTRYAVALSLGYDGYTLSDIVLDTQVEGNATAPVLPPDVSCW